MSVGVYEIEWRELLVKRLKAAQTVLKRDAANEEKQRTEARQLASGYSNYEEAHDAYGWGYISEKQLLNIEAIFNNRENQSRTALKRITQIIGSIEGEISMLCHDRDYKREVLADIAESKAAT